MKKLAVILPLSFVALVYLVAVWNASRSLEFADTLEARTAAGVEAHSEWTTQRSWASNPTRDCRAIETLVGEGDLGGSAESLGAARHALMSGAMLPEIPARDLAEATRRGRAAATCRIAGTVDPLDVEEATSFDWSAHLDTVTLLAVGAVRAGSDVCSTRAGLVAELAYDAAVGGSLEALSHATLELGLADALLARCGPTSSDDALAGALERFGQLAQVQPPVWRSLIGQSLLVEAGAQTASGDIRTFPTTPIGLQRSIFTAKILTPWQRAIRARDGVSEIAQQKEAIDAAAYWEEVFADTDDAFEFAVAVDPTRRMQRFLDAGAKLDARRADIAATLGERVYESYRAEQMLSAFEQRYAVQ